MADQLYRTKGGDLISALPDEAIHRIFSFLPLEDVVRTSVLSKRWRYRWRTNLAFDRVWSLDFRCIVDSVLSQHPSTSPLKEFHINPLVYKEADSSMLVEWLRRAEQRHAEDLRLELPPSLQAMYILPQFLFSLSRLVRLRVSRCCFLLGATSINRLKFLSSSNVNLSDISWMAYDLLKELLEKLRRVPTIIIAAWCLQILSLMEMKGVSPLSLTCQNLILHGPVSQCDLPGIAYTLRSSQSLEKLVIHLTGYPMLKFQVDEESKEGFNFDEEDFLCSQKGNFESLAEHLKRVEIIGFGAFSFGSNHMLPLIKFLLGHALVLEKLIIKVKLPTRQGQCHLSAGVLSKLLDLSSDVLSFRRASENAEVIFDYPLEWFS